MVDCSAIIEKHGQPWSTIIDSGAISQKHDQHDHPMILGRGQPLPS